MFSQKVHITQNGIKHRRVHTFFAGDANILQNIGGDGEGLVPSNFLIHTKSLPNLMTPPQDILLYFH